MRKPVNAAGVLVMALVVAACAGAGSVSQKVRAAESADQSQTVESAEQNQAAESTDQSQTADNTDQSQAAPEPEKTLPPDKWDTEREETVKENGCVFHAFMSRDGKESWIYKIEIQESGMKKLIFPEAVQGAPVTRLACGGELYDEDDDLYYDIFHNILEPWHNCYDTIPAAVKIETIDFPSAVTEIEAGAFCGLVNLKQIKIPDGVEKLEEYTFAACKSLKKVEFPQNLKSIEPYAFKKTGKISSISISKKSSYQVKKGVLIEKAKKKAVWVVPAKKKVVIPSGVKELGPNLFLSAKATSVEVPKTVKKMGYKALSGKKISKMVLKKGNSVFARDGGSIYIKKSRRLVAVLVDKKRRVKISSKVKILGEGISVMGQYIDRVDIPKSVRRVIEYWMFWEGSQPAIYFHGMKPPVIQSQYNGQVFTALPIFDAICVPKKAKKAYIKWAADRDGLKWENLTTF